MKNIKILLLIFTLLSGGSGVVRSQGIYDKGDYLEIVTKTLDTTLIPKAGAFIEKKNTSPNVVYLNAQYKTWTLTPADYGYASAAALKAALERKLFGTITEPYIQTFTTAGVLPVTLTFQSSDTTILTAIAFEPLPGNTDTVFVSTSRAFNGIAAGNNGLVNDSKPFAFSGWNLGAFTLTIENDAGCKVIASFIRKE